jgi:hypothetical protein
MVSRPITPEPTALVDQPRQVTSNRPEEALRRLAADLSQVSTVVVQTEALSWKMVELGQSLAQLKPAVEDAARSLTETNQKVCAASDRLYRSADALEENYRNATEVIEKRLRILTRLVTWSLVLGAGSVAAALAGMFLYISRL